MSGWQEYIDHIRSTGVVQQAFILSHDGAFWAGSNILPGEYEVTVTNDDYSEGKEKVNEGANLVKIWNNKGMASKITKAGIRINGHKFQSINFDEDKNTWYLAGQIDGISGGATVAKTGLIFIIGIWQVIENVKYAAECSAMIESVQKLLVDNGS